MLEGRRFLFGETLEISLGHFIGGPADGGTGHSRDDTGPHAAQETAPTKLALDDRRRVEETPSRSNFLTLGETTGLQEGLDHIERGRDTGSKGTGQTTRHAVSERIVLALGIHDLGDGLIGDELCGGKRHGHAESRRVRDIEGLETFGAVHGLGALHQTFVNGTVDLHSLLHD